MTSTWYLQEIDESVNDLRPEFPNVELENRSLNHVLNLQSSSGGSSLSFVRDQLFLFGGCNRTGTPSGSLYSYSLSNDTWELIESKNNVPCARFGHTAVTVDSSIFIYGGIGPNSECSSTDESLNQLFQFDTATRRWVKNPHGHPIPPPLHSHTCVVDKDHNLLIFAGFRHEVGLTNELWSYSTNTNLWTEIKFPSEDSPIPAPREMHAAVYCEDNNSMYVMGGRTRNGEEFEVCRDLWRLCIQTMTWTLMPPSPSPRCAHTGSVLRSQSGTPYLIFHGGWDGSNTIFDDSAVYNIEHDTWIDASHVGASFERFAHAATTISDSKLIVYGGINAQGDFRDLIELSLTEVQM